MNPSAYQFTCNSCQVAFRNSDLQRTHMQSDWHRYNLKRRVASLPPLTSEVFAEKVLANKATAAATAAKASFEKRCDACEKTYYSEGAYLNHLKSQKHRLLQARMNARAGSETESMADSTFSLGEPMEAASTTASTATVGAEDADVESVTDEVDEVAEAVGQVHLNGTRAPISSGHKPDAAMNDEEYEHHSDAGQCLFCNYMAPNIQLNVAHMSRQHGFFIPEKEYLVDLPGLLNYLSETINVLHTCLYCHKTVHTAAGAQTHMRDRGHCMIAYSTEEEQLDVGDFYDFRSTYSDEESEEDEEVAAEGGVSLGVKRAVKTTVEGGDGDGELVEDDEDEGWESDSTLSSVPTDEITSVPIEHQEHKYAKLDLHRHHSHHDPRPHRNTDGFHSHAHHTPTAVYHDDYELHLPSGRTAGHRSLRTYFRQNLRSYPSAEERAERQLLEDGRGGAHADEEESPSQDAETDGDGRGRQLVTRANGGLGMLGVSEAKKREVRAVEKRQQRRMERAQNAYQWGKEKRANHQKHFRDPLLQ